MPDSSFLFPNLVRVLAYLCALPSSLLHACSAVCSGYPHLLLLHTYVPTPGPLPPQTLSTLSTTNTNGAGRGRGRKMLGDM